MNDKQARAALIDAQLEKHPEMQAAERTIFVLLIAFVVLRIVPAVLQTIYVAVNGGLKTDCLMNYILIILSGLFAVMVAQGVKFFAVLGALCGGYSLLALWLDLTLTGGVVPPGGPLYVAYLATLVPVCFVQIGIMLYILLSHRCRAYLTLLDSVNKDYYDGDRGGN